MAEAPRNSPLVRVRKLLGRIRRQFAVDTFDVFVRPVPAPGPFEPPPGYVFDWGTPADVERCDVFHTELDERERAQGVQRLGLGHKLVLGQQLTQQGGLIVFTMWVNPRNLNVPGLMKRALGPGQWFIYKAYTSPEHRGRKLYESGMRFVLCEMRSSGLTELVGYAHVKKDVSRKGLATLQFASAGRVTQLAWPGLKLTFLSRELRARFPREVPRSGGAAAETEPLRPA
jgi:hypothetical protein